MNHFFRRSAAAAAAAVLLMSAAMPDLKPFTAIPVFAADAAETPEEIAARMTVSYTASRTLAASFGSMMTNGLPNFFLSNAQKEKLSPAPLKPGDVMDKKSYYLAELPDGSAITGKQCYIFSQAVSALLMGEFPLHGIDDKMPCAFRRTEQIVTGAQELTPELLRENRVMPGAYIRTTANADGSYSSSYGHSMVLLGYSDSEVHIFHGNADAYGLVNQQSYTYEQFNRVFLTNKGRIIGQIIQLQDEYYQSEYGISADHFYGTVTEAPLTEWEAPDLTVHRLGTPVQLELPEGAKVRSWTSKDEFAVTVDQNGLATPLRCGTSDVIAMSDDCIYRFRIKVDALTWEEVGDSDGNGIVDPVDATNTLREYSNFLMDDVYSLPQTSLAYMDVNDDGEVDPVDASLMLRYFSEETLLECEDTPEEIWDRLLHPQPET